MHTHAHTPVEDILGVAEHIAQHQRALAEIFFFATVRFRQGLACVYMCEYVFVYVCVCMCICVCISVYTGVCIYMHVPHKVILEIH